MKAKGLFGVLYSVCAVITAACVFLFVVCFCAYFVQRKFVYPVKYEKEIVAASEEFGVDKFFVFATVKAESGFNADRKRERAYAVNRRNGALRGGYARRNRL